MPADSIGFLETLIAALVGGGLVAYLQGRLTEAGRLAALKKASEQIIESALERSRAEEAGKRAATHEDIENVLRELRLTTKEAEQIRSDIQHAVWQDQSLWNLKVEHYSRLLSSMGELISILSERRELLEVVAKREQSGEPLPRELIERMTEARRAFIAVETGLSRTIAVSGITLRVDAIAEVSAIFAVHGRKLLEVDSVRELMRAVDRGISKVQMVAKEDLGRPPR